MAEVLVAMGSKSDYETVKPAADILKQFGISVTVKVMSAHRTPETVKSYASGEADKDIKVIIAAAGKAAHLAGFMAAFTTLPVIGIPIKTSDLGGMDSLLSTVQMPSGVPVATVAINGAKNAGILAAQILALSNPVLADKLKEYKKDMEREVIESDKFLSEDK